MFPISFVKPLLRGQKVQSVAFSQSQEFARNVRGRSSPKDEES